MQHIYGSRIWNFLRRTLYGTDKVDQIVEIDDECYSQENDIYCYHKVKYLHNGLEQTEVFSCHKILQLCNTVEYPFQLSSHFSTRKWMSETLDSLE